MLTRIISIILICSLVLVPTSVFASSGPGAPWDATYNWYNVGSDGSGDMNNGNVLYGLSQISRSLMWIGQWVYDGLEQIDTVNSWLNSIYSNMNSYTSLIYDRVNGYLPTMSNNIANLYNRVDSMYTNIVNISGYNNAQLTQLQQINMNLNNYNWQSLNNTFNGISSDGLEFNLVSLNNTNSDVYFKITVDDTINNNRLYRIRIPYTINPYANIDSVTIILNNRASIVIRDLYLLSSRLYFDVLFNFDYSSNSIAAFVIKFSTDSRYSFVRQSNNSQLWSLNSDSKDFWDLKEKLVLYQISNKLDNIEVSVDTSDIVDAINALDITQDVDVDISQDINQTTNLITQLRNLFGTGVSIPQFVQQTKDQSFLGWFSQSNSDDINHISTGYNEAPY